MNILTWNRQGSAVKTIEQMENITMNISVVQEIRGTDDERQEHPVGVINSWNPYNEL